MDEKKKIRLPRNFEGIFVHKLTLECAANKCLPCLYKINPNGVWNMPYTEDIVTIKSNQRPEMCPRSHSEVYNGIYSRNYRILTVGDGDFSFSLSIAKYLGKEYASKLISTSHESLSSVLETYHTSSSILEQLRTLGTHVHHSIDATKLSSEVLKFPYKKFDRIIWNFPCVRVSDGLDGQATELEINIKLVRDFFMEAKLILQNKNNKFGEIHVAHKTFEPFCWWNIENIASECGLVHVGSIIFDRYLYPGYINRKVLDKKSFPFHDAMVYVFRNEMPENDASRLKSTFELLDTLVCLERDDAREILTCAVSSLAIDSKIKPITCTVLMKSKGKKRKAID